MSDIDEISGENYSYPVCITGKNLEIMRWIVEFLLSQEQSSILESIYILIIYRYIPQLF